MAGTGIFNQSGGTNYVTDELDVGGADPSWNAAIMATPLINTASGVYTLSSGLLLTSQARYALGEYVGVQGTGVFTQTGGSNITAGITLGGVNATTNNPAPGTYNLRGGLLQVAGISNGGGPATFNFTGGTLQAEPPALNNNGQGGLSLWTPVTIGA